jgi:aspartyl-tRNA(Asn)/glutamyl-tRNA(Gln) amidotransferase subunit B
MQEGSLRCDANVNIHIEQDGKTIATPIVEIKNLNSFRSVERAIQYEAERQYKQWKLDGKTIKDAPKQTVGWIDAEGKTKVQREKETAADYRYFPEPDLVPVVVDEAWIGRVKASVGELPSQRRKRFSTEYGLSDYDVNVLVEQGQDVADYYDAVAKETGAFKLASNWVQQDILRIVKERKIPIGEFPVGPASLADLINRVGRSELNTNQGREVLAKMIETGEPADAIIEAGGYKMVSDQGTIVAAIEAALASNPKALEDLKGGKKKPDAVKGFLRGQVMKQTGGKADPALVGELLDAKLAELAG